MATADLSPTQREALKAIHRLQSTSVGGTHTGDLAVALDRSAATACAVVKQLAELGFVEHRPYRGVELTRRGEDAASTALRRHQVVERFLADVLGFAVEDAGRLATSFEHALPAEVEQRMDAAIRRQRSAVTTNQDIERRERAC